MATERRYRGIGPVPTEALARLGEGGDGTQLSAAVQEVTRFLEQLRDVQTRVAAGLDAAASAPATGSGSPSPAPAPTPGPPGPPGPPYVPDLTPPPTPTGVTVSAGLDFVFITTDPPTFTEGNGYNRTLVYGAQYGGTGPLPTFGAAVLVHEFVGQVGSFATPPNSQWHIWLKWRTNDGVLSVSPEGGANGHQVTTSSIGNVHLGPLIVEAGNLANGSVTATKLAAEAVTLTAFAASLRPVRVLGVLPALPAAGYLDGDTAVLTTDGKLYRIVSGSWTRAVDGADLIANSITTGSIAAGAVTATQIAAQAIRTSHLLVTGQGATMTPDPMAQDPSAWTFAGSAGQFVTGIADLPVGSTALQNPVGQNIEASTTLIPVDQSKNYRLEMLIKRHAGAGDVNYLGISWHDAAGALLPSNAAQPAGAGNPAGWSNGTFSYYGLVNASAPSTWTAYGISFGPDEVAKIPSNARFMRPIALLNYGSAGGVTVRLSGVRLWEKANADLIVNGSIIASKIAANAIAVGTAAIQNGAIVNAMIANATITDAKIVTLSASKIIAGSLAVGEYIQSSGFTPGGVGFRIDGGGGAEFRFSGGTRVFHLGASGTDPVLRAPGLDILANGSATFSGTVSAATIVGSTISGGLIQSSASGQRVTINEAGSNEARFYGDRGDGTIEQLASIGITSVGSDFVIGNFGSATSSRTAIMARANGASAIYGIAYSNFTSAIVGQSLATGGVGVSGTTNSSIGVGVAGTALGAGARGINGTNLTGPAVYGETNTGTGVHGVAATSGGRGVLGQAVNLAGVRGESSSGAGVEGSSTSGHGFVGSSSSGYGAHLTGNATRGALFLTPVASAPSDASNGGVAIINTALSLNSGVTTFGYTLCFANGSAWISAVTNRAWNDPGPDTGGP